MNQLKDIIMGGLICKCKFDFMTIMHENFEHSVQNIDKVSSVQEDAFPCPLLKDVSHVPKYVLSHLFVNVAHSHIPTVNNIHPVLNLAWKT